MVVSVSRTSLMVGWFRSKALLALLEEGTAPSAVRDIVKFLEIGRIFGSLISAGS